MSISAEEKKRYFAETALALRREGFHVEKVLGGQLGVGLDDQPLCEVSEVGGITYKCYTIPTPERVAAKDKVYRIVSNTAEYMRQMEQAPPLKASGLEDSYKVLADFNGTVLAGTHSKYGVQFVTWDWDYDRKGVSHGHYFPGNDDGPNRTLPSAPVSSPNSSFSVPSSSLRSTAVVPTRWTQAFGLTYEQEKCIQSLQEYFKHHFESFFQSGAHWK